MPPSKQTGKTGAACSYRRWFLMYFLHGSLATIGISAFALLCVTLILGFYYAIWFLGPLCAVTIMLIFVVGLAKTLHMRAKGITPHAPHTPRLSKSITP